MWVSKGWVVRILLDTLHVTLMHVFVRMALGLILLMRVVVRDFRSMNMIMRVIAFDHCRGIVVSQLLPLTAAQER